VRWLDTAFLRRGLPAFGGARGDQGLDSAGATTVSRRGAENAKVRIWSDGRAGVGTEDRHDAPHNEE